MQDAKKVLDTVLQQLSTLTNLPNTDLGHDLSQRIPTCVENLTKFIPDLELLKVMKKHPNMAGEKELKVFLGQVASGINDALEVVKLGKAWQK